MRSKLLIPAFALTALLQLSVLPTAASAQATPPHAQGPASNAKKLSRAEVDELLARPGEVLFLDVRRPDEISTIGGFPVYLSVQITDLDKHLSEIPKDKLIVTVSNHAGRAGKAADLLESKGFKVAGAVGAQSYEAEGGHLTKISIPPPTAAK